MTTPASTLDFFELIRKSGLIENGQLEEVISKYGSIEEVQQCATALVRASLLTSYQAKQILTGRYRGFLLGAYKILKPIGQGGMGQVYLAEHTALKRNVAIKVMTPEQAKDKLSMERFFREARAVAALDHPNIVRLYDICHTAGMHYLVMEYIDGTDLQTLMAQQGPYEYQVAAGYIAQAAEGLAHAHENGFIHRDIKPANLILTTKGRVKILDMGLTRAINNPNDQLTTNLGNSSDVAGTVDYIAPEQALNEAIDARSDIYSLGASFYAMVTGNPPFLGTTAQKLVQHQVKEPVPLSQKLNGNIPDSLSKIVAKMMAKDPNDRYQSVQQLIEALGPWRPQFSSSRLSKSTNSLVNNEFGKTSDSIRDLSTSTPPSIRLNNSSQRTTIAIVGSVLLILLVATMSWFVIKSNKAARLTTDTPEPSPPTLPTPTPSTQASLPNPTPPKPNAFVPQLVYQTQWKDQPTDVYTFEDGLSSAGTSEILLAPGVIGYCWDPRSIGAIRVDAVGGKNIFACVNQKRAPSAQLVFNMAEFVPELDPSLEYRVRLQYQSQGEATSMMRLETTQPHQHLMELPLPPQETPDWVELTFPGQQLGRLRLVVANLSTDPNQVLSVHALQIHTVRQVKPSIAPTEVKPLYTLDFSKLTVGKFEFNNEDKKRKVISGQPTLPLGWNISNSGGPAFSSAFYVMKERSFLSIGFHPITDALKSSATQLSHNPKMELLPGNTYEIRMEYRAGKDSAATIEVRRKWEEWMNNKYRWNIGPTNNTWEQFSIQFKPEERWADLIVISSRGPSAGQNQLEIRSFHIQSVK